MVARTPYFTVMAREYLDDRVTEDKPIILTPLTLYGSVQIGGSHVSDPRRPEFVGVTAKESDAFNLRANAAAQRWFPFGSVSLNYTLENNHYFSASHFDLMKHDMDVPVAIHVGANEDIVFRPLGSFSLVGGQNYQSVVGLGVQGIVFRSTYRQSVQGLIYKDRIYPSSLEGLDGTHYRFEYNWDFFPLSWFFQVLLWIEHQNADNDVVNGVPSPIPYSHTDVGLRVNLQHEFKWLSLGLNSRLISRTDSDTSTYAVRTTGQVITKRRQDFDVVLQPNLSIPLYGTVQLVGWYEWQRIFSNMGPIDYADRNYQNHVVGVALKATVSNY
jgi:hypothetical protein